MTQEFEREQRYVVLKVKDVMQRLSEKDILTLARILDEIDAYRKSIGKKSLECVVIESDWPEYEPTWKAIEGRVTCTQPAPSVPAVPTKSLKPVLDWLRNGCDPMKAADELEILIAAAPKPEAKL